MTTTMLSYHNDPAIKAKYIARFEAHRAADEVIQGRGFEQGRGCFVGCTLDAYQHDRFPIELGWPEWLAHVADVIFEGLPTSEAAQFGTDLLEAVPVGVCLEPVQSQFLLAVQRRSLARVRPDTHKAAPKVVASIETVIRLLEKDEPASSAEWSAARSAARSAGSAASSAGSASASAAVLAAWSAAELAEWSASSAGSAARSAAVLAASSAAELASAELSSASVAVLAAWSARLAENQQQRDDLLAMCSDLNQTE